MDHHCPSVFLKIYFMCMNIMHVHHMCSWSLSGVRRESVRSLRTEVVRTGHETCGPRQLFLTAKLSLQPHPFSKQIFLL